MRFAPAPDPAHIDVEHRGRCYKVVLRRHPSARKMTLRVSSSTGEPVMTIPTGTPLTAAVDFAQRYGGWIASKVVRVQGRCEFVPGATLPIRGVDHVVLHVGERRSPTEFGRDESGSPAILVHGLAASIPLRIREFLSREARRDLEAAVARHCASIGRKATRITVKDTTSRWGSCTARGELSFSWRLILAPPFVLDYLAAHECGHLAEMNHSHRFWKAVRDICPRTDEAESWLKRNGGSLHRYG